METTAKRILENSTFGANSKKELRVFVVSADDDSLPYNVSGYLIDEWANWNENELPNEAKKFIDIAEQRGNVYSLNKFLFAFNIEESIGMNDYIFITDKY
jgi:hypothetical protein